MEGLTFRRVLMRLRFDLAYTSRNPRCKEHFSAPFQPCRNLSEFYSSSHLFSHGENKIENKISGAKCVSEPSDPHYFQSGPFIQLTFGSA